MPKGKRKVKNDRGGSRIAEALSNNLTSDDESNLDNASIISNASETRSTAEEGGGGSSEVDEQAQQEAFEDKLMEAIDGLNQKSAQGRTNCFEAVAKALVMKYVPDFLFDRRATLCDSVERALKKGRGAEQTAAAHVAPLLCVQLGAGSSAASEEVLRELKPLLTTTAQDASAAPLARAKCCWALGLLTFLSGDEMGEVLALMADMQTLFAGSYLKGDGNLQTSVGADAAALHAGALAAWSLLLTLMAPGDVYGLLGSGNRFTPSLRHLMELLRSPHLEVRMSAGEAIVLVFELGREYSADFQEELVPELCDVLRSLATDSHKYRAKKDRKTQRATFRDILHYIEEDLYTDVQVRFGQEVLCLDSWCRRRQYDAMCQTLGSGLNLHLTENELLRDIFQLGPKLILADVNLLKQTKLERHLINAANFKARTVARSKNRDKRSAAFS